MRFMNIPYDESDSPGPAHMTEAEAEQLQARQELLLDRVHARFRRERAQRLLEIFREEIERLREEEKRSGKELGWEIHPAETADEAVDAFGDDDDCDEDPAEVPEFNDPEAPAEEHPLAKSARELAESLGRELISRKLIPRDASPEHPLVELGTSTYKAALKLDLILHNGAFPPALPVTALCIVQLKRARGHLDDALAALDDAFTQQLADPLWLSEIRQSLEALAAGALKLVMELRNAITDGGAGTREN
jgi:hypothetical protein